MACVWKSVGNAWAYVVYDTERLKPYLVSQLFQNLKDLAGDFDDGVNGTALIIHDRKGTEEALTLHLHRTATERRRLLDNCGRPQGVCDGSSDGKPQQ